MVDLWHRKFPWFPALPVECIVDYPPVIISNLPWLAGKLPLSSVGSSICKWFSYQTRAIHKAPPWIPFSSSLLDIRWLWNVPRLLYRLFEIANSHEHSLDSASLGLPSGNSWPSGTSGPNLKTRAANGAQCPINTKPIVVLQSVNNPYITHRTHIYIIYNLWYNPYRTHI